MVCRARARADRASRAAGRHVGGLRAGGLRGAVPRTRMEAGWRQLLQQRGVRQHRGRGSGSPQPGGVPPGQPLELAGARKWRLIPSRPAVFGARGNQKQLKIPDFPFYLAEGWGKHRGGDGKATGQSSTFSRCTGLDASAPAALAPGGNWPCPVILGSAQGRALPPSVGALAAADRPACRIMAPDSIQDLGQTLISRGPQLLNVPTAPALLLRSPLQKKALQKAVNLRRGPR